LSRQRIDDADEIGNNGDDVLITARNQVLVLEINPQMGAAVLIEPFQLDPATREAGNESPLNIDDLASEKQVSTSRLAHCSNWVSVHAAGIENSFANGCSKGKRMRDRGGARLRPRKHRKRVASSTAHLHGN